MTPARTCNSRALSGLLGKHCDSFQGWSGRSLHRALKVARTVADLAGVTRIGVPHLAEAMQYRWVLVSA